MVIETKHSVGDMVYFFSDSKIFRSQIEAIIITNNGKVTQVVYTIDAGINQTSFNIHENSTAKTKEELVNVLSSFIKEIPPRQIIKTT